MLEVIKQTKPIARKVHKCDYCGLTIVIGEKYGYAALKMDGEFYIWKNHLSCQILASKLNLFEEASPDGVNDEFFGESVIQKYSDLTGDKHPEEDWEYIINYVKEHFKL